MIEKLRMQEVSEIIFSVPKGANIKGLNYQAGEAVMVINNPNTSQLSFLGSTQTASDGKGLLGFSNITNTIDFQINEGSILFALWSYLQGSVQKDYEMFVKKASYETAQNRYIALVGEPRGMYVYETNEDGSKTMIPSDEYEVIYDTVTETYFVKLASDRDGDSFFLSYNYGVETESTSFIKQIQNNIICDMDIYINAVDLSTEDKKVVYIHCDKVQLDMDLAISLNSSNKASFTPIRVLSIADGNEFNKNIATISVL